jgi:hypothetical protein
MLPVAIATRFPLALLLLIGGTLGALADPPGRVGRLSYVEGTVSFHAGDQEQWAAAVLNYPVTSGTAFWTEPESRAEIQIGGAEVRLDQSTELDIVRLDDEGTQLHVGQGVVNVHLRSAPPNGIHVVTPHSEADLLKAGSYRIDAGVARGSALPEQVQIAVLEGEARINEPRASLDIRPGESAVIGGEPVSFTLVETSSTPFDDWSLMRERREEVSESARYVSPEVTGYEDLDRYGHWRTSPSRGAVWYPISVPAGWAPYRYGHWAYVQPWGWTWVDDAAWGFAPFHYGRWVNDDEGGWGWHPGERVAQPIYAPALVAFIGGAGWGVSLSVGSAPAVGWVPLAPSEVFHPYYPTSVNYVRNVNISNVTRTEINNITVNNTTVNNTTVNNFANQRAATVVPSAAFTRAAPVQQATLALPNEQLAQVPVMAKVDHLQPTLAARAGIARPAATQVPVPGPNTPATVARDPVVARASSGIAAPDAADPPAPKAPGPVIGAKIPASAVARPSATAATPPATTTAEPAPGPTAVAPAAPAPSTSPNAPPVQSQAMPLSTAAPGPPIAHPGAAPPARAATANAAPAAPVKPEPSAAPGPPIAHATAPPRAGASPDLPALPAASAAPQAAPQPSSPAIAQVGEKPSVTSAPPQIAHAPAVTPNHAATPPSPAPSPAIAHPSPPAVTANNPPPAARPIPVAPLRVAHAPEIAHPVQQTQIVPTPSGWVRAQVPAPPMASHAATPSAAPVRPPHVAPAPAPHADPAKKPDQTKDKTPGS